LPVPTATAVYDGGEVLLEKNLDDNSLLGWYSPWCLNSSNPGQVWSIVEESDGNKVLAGKAPEGDECGIFIGADTWSNYLVEFDAMVITLGLDGNGGAAGFLMSLRTGSTCAGYETGFGGWNYFGISEATEVDNRCSFEHLNAAQWRAISRNEWHTVKIALYLSNIQVFLDGELLHDIDDNGLKNGKFNVMLLSKGEVYFDNFRVTELMER
jgi:hypothetical protein